MKKQNYLLVFPMGMCGEKTVEVHLNPLSVKEVVKQIIISQPLVFGGICIIQDFSHNVLGIAYQCENAEVKIFTEDDDAEQVKKTEELDAMP